MSYKTAILYIVMGGAQNATAQRSLLKQSAADLRLPIHAVMMGDEGDHRHVSFASSEASGVDGAVVMTAHAPSAARLIANGCPTIYCHNEAIWADSAPWRIAVRSGEEIPVALAENPRPLPSDNDVLAQFAREIATSATNNAPRIFFEISPKHPKVAERWAGIKAGVENVKAADLDMDSARYATMGAKEVVAPPIAFAYPSNVEEAKKPKRGRVMPKKQLYPYRDENGVIWVSKTKKITPRFIRLYAPIAKSVARAVRSGNSVESIADILTDGGQPISAAQVWTIKQGIKAGAWPDLK